MFVEPYLLEKVYQRGSLKNTTEGFQFTLKNLVESGTLGGVKSLSVDGAEVPLASIAFKTIEGERRVEEISYRSPVYLRYNAEAIVTVTGEPLAPGFHHMILTITVLEAGRLDLKFQDEIPEAGPAV